MRYKYIACIAAFSIWGFACTHDHSDHHHDEAGPAEEHEHQHSHENVVVMLPTEAEHLNITITEAFESTINESYPTIALVQPVSGQYATVSASTAGIVSFVSNPVIGQSVSQGTPLFSINSDRMSDNRPSEQLESARIEFEQARAELDRIKGLVADRLATNADLNSATSAYRQADARLKNLRSVWNGSGTRSAASPISGYIGQILVTPGQYVEAGAPLATIVQNRDTYLIAELPVSKSSMLDKLSGATVTIPGTNRNESIHLDARVVNYAKSLDNGKSTIPVTLAVTNPGSLISGSFVDVTLYTSDGTSGIAVPDESLIEESGQFFVYKKIDFDEFEKTPVKVGVSDGRNVRINSGVAVGDSIVGHGAILLKLRQAAGSQKLDPHAGHNHG